MFNECLLKFERSFFDSKSIGEIVKQNIELFFLENYKNPYELDMASKISWSALEPGYFPRLNAFKNNNFCLIGDTNKTLNAVCIDQDGKILSEKKNLIPSKKIKEFIYIMYCISIKRIVFVFTCENHFGEETDFYKLRSFDENFNKLAKINLVNDPLSLQANGEMLFLENESENQEFQTISIYNFNLDLIQKVGQGNRLLPFFLPNNIYELNIGENVYIFNDREQNQSNLTILSRITGLVEKSFFIPGFFHQIELYMEKYLLALNCNTHSIQIYNLNGDYMCEIYLDERIPEGSFFYILKKKLCFVGDDGKTFIF